MSPSSSVLTFEAEMAMAHVPVLREELVDVLGLRPDSRVLDATFGAGGHAHAVAERMGPEALFVACDRDPVAQEYFDQFSGEVSFTTRYYPGNYAEVMTQLAAEGMTFTHIYMDLGVSSMQLDVEERGFSYSYDAPLDMRMDPDTGTTAADLLNSRDEKELARIFREYGEERYSRRIAREVVRRRASRPYTRTSELVETVKDAIPTPARFGARNPARRVFQALRIAVNDELDNLRRALPAATELLAVGGVLAVISFHSLEDRIVKDFFRDMAEPCICPPDFPVCVCGRRPSLEVLTKRPVTPSPRETATNPRSSSAKLRAARRI